MGSDAPSSALRRIAGQGDGIVFGDMRQCVAPEEADYLDRAILHSLRDFDGPIAIGLRSGHVGGETLLRLWVLLRRWILRRRGIRGCTFSNCRYGIVLGLNFSTMQNSKHIHLIGICGTAMASLAGMLQLQGHRITGSDTAAYPPMSDLLAGLGIPIREPYAEANLDPRPDLVVVGNAISRGKNVELEYVLDQRIRLFDGFDSA